MEQPQQKYLGRENGTQYDGLVKCMLQDYYDDRILVKTLRELCFKQQTEIQGPCTSRGCGNVATLRNSKASEASQSYEMQPAVRAQDKKV